MDKGDIWLPQKRPQKIPGAEAAALTTGSLLAPGHKFTILITRIVATSELGLPGKEDCLVCHMHSGLPKPCELACKAVASSPPDSFGLT